MVKYELYNPKKIYITPSGAIADSEWVYNNYPASKSFKYIVGTDEAGETMFEFQSFQSLKSLNNIPISLSDEEAILQMEAIRNAPPEVDETPTAEERIAAAMEFQNMMSIPDETTTS